MLQRYRHHMSAMASSVFYAELPGRAVLSVRGPDWRQYLQGLVTQDVEGLADGQLRFAALLSPQGKVLFDLFLVGTEQGCLIDCSADCGADLAQKLLMYRLRAKVEVETTDMVVSAVWGASVPTTAMIDPRLPELGSRGYGTPPPSGATLVGEDAYREHCMRLGVPGAPDWGYDETYPIEANFDLLGGIDFKKGCFVGQETTSRMKRRGTIKSRMVPIAFEGPPPASGTELLAGELRAGFTRSAITGRAMALLRLDRLEAGAMTMPDGRGWSVAWPPWLKSQIAD